MKKLTATVGVLILVILMVPMFLSSKFSMSRSIEINAPVATTFSKLTDLNEYVKWNPFPEGDPTNQTQVSGVGVNSFLIWKGEKTGEGKMTISTIDPEKKSELKWIFINP